MQVASFVANGTPSFGVVDQDRMLDYGAVLRDSFADLKALLAAGALDRLQGPAPSLPLDALTWLPVIPDPGKIFCIGVNYEMHRAETGRAEVPHPTVFTRFADSQTGHLTSLILPHVSHMFDYEGELAIIIGKPGRYLSQAAALAHVAGYAIFNDATLRDFQAHTHQFTPGKNFPATGGCGPWMVTADSFTPVGQRLQTRLNGTVVQEALLSQMIFSVPRLIAYCSTFTTLRPGDMIVSGTPGGVGAKRTPPLWMKAGDRVEIQIEGIGTLINTVAAEP